VTPARLVARSIRHHARASLALVTACAAATAVLIGSLAVGDSVRASLAALAENRVGRVSHVVQGRYVRHQLADDLRRELTVPVEAVVQLTGTASRADGSAATGGVQILGTDEAFAFLLPGEAALPSDGRSVVLNRELAERLGASVGDDLLLRLPRPAALSREAPFAPDVPPMAGLRLEVTAVLEPEHGGAFHLHAEQRIPPTAYVSRDTVQQRIGRLDQANLLVVGHRPTTEEVQAALDRSWRLADAGLHLQPTHDRQLQLASDGIFLDRIVEEAAARAGRHSLAISSYLANELRHGQATEPYVFVSALANDHGMVSGLPGMTDDQILLEEDTARHLGVEPGDEIELAWWRVEPGRTFVEQRRTFEVGNILPRLGRFADPDLVPSLPGIRGADSCRDWAPGVPIDLDRVGPRQEARWQEHGAVPSAVVTLAAGVQMWGGAHGGLTGVRYPADTPAEIEASMLTWLAPADAGVTVTDLGAEAGRAVEQGLDFGGLVLGFAFFLELAALLLVGLLFSLAVHDRRSEFGSLLAVGFTPRRIRALLLAEGALLAAAGALPGALLGWGFCHALVAVLAAAWPAAGGLTSLHVAIGPTSLAVGAAGGALAALAAVALATRGLGQEATTALHRSTEAAPRARPWGIVAGAALVLGGAAGAMWPAAGLPDPGRLLGAGAIGLAGGVLVFAAALGWTGTAPSLGSRWGLARRTLARRAGRSTAVVALVATAAFMVAAVESFRLDPTVRADERSAGTGGYGLWADAAVPVAGSPTAPGFHEVHGLDPAWTITPLRAHAGDDASCLNLNRAQSPRILGVPSAALHARGAFTFTAAGAGDWTALDRDLPGGVVPAMADMNTLQWALGIGVDDELVVTDGHGQPLTLRVVGALQRSVLQGAVVIDEATFRQHFPADDGFAVLLVDAPVTDEAARTLATALADHGLDVTTTVERLGSFHAVENIYLSFFQGLAALALLLGTAGLGIGLLRSVQQRRAELAMLHAIGFDRASIRGLLLREYLLLLTAGLLIGLAAAALSTAPYHLATGLPLPWLAFGATAAVIGIGGCAGLAAAATIALRGEIHAILKRER